MPATPRSTLSIDLGPLADLITAQAQATGHTRSSWIRQAIQHQLDAADPEPAAPVAAADPRPAATYRPWLAPDLAAKLDALAHRSGRRSRTTVLRALIEGVDLGVQPKTSGGRSEPSLTPEAIAHLAQSNYALVAIGRLLNQVAKSLHLYPGKASTSDIHTIERTIEAVHKHIQAVAPLVQALRPQLVRPDAPAVAANKRDRPDAPPSIQTPDAGTRANAKRRAAASK